MKSTTKLIISFFALIVFVGIVSNYKDYSYSLQEKNAWNNFTSIKVLRDDHVVPGEKVYLEFVGNSSKIDSIQIEMKYRSSFFVVSVEELNTSKPYFYMPSYSKDVVVDGKYTINKVSIEYIDGNTIVYYSNPSKGIYLDTNDITNYIVVGEKVDEANAWRGFGGLKVNAVVNDVNENIHLNLYGDYKDVVNIDLKWVKTDESYYFISSVLSVGNRPFFNLDDAKVVDNEDYYLKEIKVFYNDGGYYVYNADNYASVLNNRLHIGVLNHDRSINVEETDVQPVNAIVSKEREKDVAGGLVVLFLIFIALVLVFAVLKNEDN